MAPLLENRGTLPVGSFLEGASPFGALDCAGNVWEWCADRYGPYAADAADNPRGPASGSGRVVRGGSWSGLPAAARCSHRSSLAPDCRGSDLGFRLAGPSR